MAKVTNTFSNNQLIVAKFTYDFIIGGEVKNMKDFINMLYARFEVGKAIVDSRFLFTF